ncbi:MAG: hypothetical protein ACOWYE_06985 [Desulfatiglandales bacterium]
MGKIFGIIQKAEREPKEFQIGLRMRVADQEILCPLSGRCSSFVDFGGAVERLKRDLDELLVKAGHLFQGASAVGDLGLTPDMGAEQIWALLSEVTDDRGFVDGFNGLDEEKRKEVAEYVLTKCNVFSGRAALFSARYHDASALME